MAIGAENREWSFSTGALNVAIRIAFSGLFHQYGMMPQRMGTSARWSSPRMTTSTGSIGQTLKFG
jgi:hypothetical protein